MTGGQLAHRAYRLALDASPRMRTFPYEEREWADLDPGVRDAWEAAARAIAEEMVEAARDVVFGAVRERLEGGS